MMDPLYIAALSSSIFAIVFSIILLIYTLKYANLVKKHTQLILGTLALNIALQSGQLISVLLYYSDETNEAYNAATTVFPNYVPNANVVMTFLLDIEIITIFSIYDERITEARISRFKRVVLTACVILILPGIIFFTYLAVATNGNMDAALFQSALVIYLADMICSAGITIYDNIQAIFLLWLILRNNRNIKTRHRVLVQRLVLLNFLSAILDWVAIGLTIRTFVEYYKINRLLTWVLAGSVSGVHPGITICVFYGLQEIALDKVYKRKEAERQKALSPVENYEFSFPVAVSNNISDTKILDFSAPTPKEAENKK